MNEQTRGRTNGPTEDWLSARSAKRSLPFIHNYTLIPFRKVEEMASQLLPLGKVIDDGRVRPC